MKTDLNGRFDCFAATTTWPGPRYRRYCGLLIHCGLIRIAVDTSEEGRVGDLPNERINNERILHTHAVGRLWAQRAQ